MDNLHKLTSAGIQVWSHPSSNKLALEKYQLLLMLGPTIQAAGGFFEDPIHVNNIAQGQSLLASGHVIKWNHSCEGKHVWLPLTDFNVMDAESRFEKVLESFEKSFHSDKGKYLYFALRYNSTLPVLGEVRVYISYGQLNDMYHTTPSQSQFRATMTSQRCFNHLNSLQDMERPSRRGGRR